MDGISKNITKKIAVVGTALTATLVVAGISVSAANPPQSINGYTKDQCKNGGWQTLTDAHGHKFKNQGDCVSYFATGGKNPGNG